MKGLLLKDLYMIKAYCKSYLLIAAVFLAVSLVGENMFFLYYPCLLCGMLPVNMLAYDEKSGFLRYSAALPYSKEQIASEKYLLGLVSQVAVLTVTGIAQAIKMRIKGEFVFVEFLVIMFSILLVSVFASAIPLPFVFRYGTEKGRIAYYVMIGFVCAAGALFSDFLKNGAEKKPLTGTALVILCAVGVCGYALSWILSVSFCKKREM